MGYFGVIMNEKDRILNVIEILKATYGDAHIALKSENPFQLLVSVILSAQCTDVRVNQVTPVLFDRFPDVRSMSEAPIEELEEIIRSTGFFRNKSKNIKAASRIIVERFKGELPRLQRSSKLTHLCSSKLTHIMHISFLAHPYFFHYHPCNVTILFDLPGG